jgi:hypothetical protein
MDSKPIKDFVQSQATESNVRSMFDNSVFGLARGPTLGDTAAESAAIVGEYRSILQESIFDAGGDTSAATKLAAQRFKRVYGTSVFTMSGDGVVTRLPPERPSFPRGCRRSRPCKWTRSTGDSRARTARSDGSTG